MVMPSPLAEPPLAHGGLLGPRVGRIEQVEVLSLEVGRGQAVGDQDDLPVGRVLAGEHLPGQLQAVLDVGEVRRDLHLADAAGRSCRPAAAPRGRRSSPAWASG